jgi:hypothetical protein
VSRFVVRLGQQVEEAFRSELLGLLDRSETAFPRESWNWRMKVELNSNEKRIHLHIFMTVKLQKFLFLHLAAVGVSVLLCLMPFMALFWKIFRLRGERDLKFHMTGMMTGERERYLDKYGRSFVIFAYLICCWSFPVYETS